MVAPFLYIVLILYKIKIWEGEIIKEILKRREECDTYLTYVCRHHCSDISSFHWVLSISVMSTDVSQVSVALFPSF
jgi:hypothetical protein